MSVVYRYHFHDVPAAEAGAALPSFVLIVLFAVPPEVEPVTDLRLAAPLPLVEDDRGTLLDFLGRGGKPGMTIPHCLAKMS